MLSSLGIIKQSFVMSIQNIKANKMRSFLTMLGIVIGVAAVIGLITIVETVSDAVMGKFSGLGAGTVMVMAYTSPTKDGLSDVDVDVLSKVEGVEGVSPTAEEMTASVVDKEVYKKTRVQGRSTTYFSHNPDAVTAGRVFNEADMSGESYVCIVDQDYIKKCLLGRQVLGREILVNGNTYTIVGVAKKDDSLMSYMSDTSRLDGTIIVPYRNVLSMSGKTRIYNLDVYVKKEADMSMVESRLRSALQNMYNDNDDYYSVVNMESLMSMMDSVQGMLGTLLASIASIALVVGGIGIMNMMLVSVSERTKEIGLRKALGAEPSRIQMQFLIESIVLSMIGGIIGVIIGLAIAFAAAHALETPFTVPGSAITLGVGFSAAVGIVFGWVPAKRASELNPIDALRSE